MSWKSSDSRSCWILPAKEERWEVSGSRSLVWPCAFSLSSQLSGLFTPFVCNWVTHGFGFWCLLQTPEDGFLFLLENMCCCRCLAAPWFPQTVIYSLSNQWCTSVPVCDQKGWVLFEELCVCIHMGLCVHEFSCPLGLDPLGYQIP